MFEAIAVAAIWMFRPSMKADVADYDEVHTNHRREGSLNTLYSWPIKTALTCSFGLGGVMLQPSGFDAKLPAQPPEVPTRIFHLYLAIPIVIWSPSLAVICFPLPRLRAAEIRTEFEQRRGKR